MWKTEFEREKGERESVEKKIENGRERERYAGRGKERHGDGEERKREEREWETVRLRGYEDNKLNDSCSYYIWWLYFVMPCSIIVSFIDHRHEIHFVIK